MSPLVSTLVTAPLRTLYFNGPTMLGFWGGAGKEDICYSLTGTTANFWIQHFAQCLQLCDQKFDAFRTVVVFISYSFLLYRLLTTIAFHLLFTRPILNELRALRAPQN